MPKGDAKEGYLNTNAHLEAKVALLMAQLAESQAREAKMRIGLAAAIKEADGWHDECRGDPCEGVDWCRDILAIPQDDSALREVIEAAKAEEREMCAKACEGLRFMVLQPTRTYSAEDICTSQKDIASHLSKVIRARKG